MSDPDLPALPSEATQASEELTNAAARQVVEAYWGEGEENAAVARAALDSGNFQIVMPLQQMQYAPDGSDKTAVRLTQPPAQLWARVV